jgi:CheY-like chemotaxis protein
MISYPKVLLVDDEAIPALSLSLELKRSGYAECHIEATGERAVQAALQGGFGVVIMDIHLAGKIDGLEAMRRIRAANFSMPVVFISGYDDAAYRRRAEELGPGEYLVKPVNVTELKSAISRLLLQPKE